MSWSAYRASWMCNWRAASARFSQPAPSPVRVRASAASWSISARSSWASGGTGAASEGRPTRAPRGPRP
eukprot:6689698-Alexandrium_andersonii.AAC.1